MKKYKDFPGTYKMSDEERQRREDDVDKIPELNLVQDKGFLQDIFCPDPETGNPCNDLVINNASPEVRDFIHNELHRYRLDIEKSDDPDLALKMTKSNFESRDAYFERIREYVTQLEQ